MVQLALMARLAGQFVVVLKLEVLGCCVIEEMLSAANPVFVRVTFCATLVEPTLVFGKFRVVPESVTSGAFTPTPDSVTVCGLLAALSVKMMAPERVPVAVGVKVTLIVQNCPPRRPAGQLLVCA